MMLHQSTIVALFVGVVFAQSNVFAPDRTANDEPLIYRQWNQTLSSKNSKSNNNRHMTMAPLAAAGNTPDKPIRLLFWKKNMDVWGEDFSMEPGYTDCGADLHCEISNERSSLTRAHVVLFLEQRDRDTLTRMYPWQAAAVFVPTTIMSYIDGARELADVDAVLGYSPRWADLIVDHTAGWLRFAADNGTRYRDGAEESVEAAWWENGWCGVYPPEMRGRDYDLAMFNNDCVSLDAVYGGRYAHRLFQTLHADHNITANSYGSCLTSHTLPNAIDTRDPAQVFAEMRRHRLVFIHETTRTRDYVTEQIFWALAAGAIPVYIGAPNVQEFLPCGGHQVEAEAPCFVDASRLAPEEVARVVAKILREPLEFDRFHKWRVMQWRGGERVTARYSVLRKGPDSFTCRLCRWYKERSAALDR